jgi:predicted RNA binding protein YcfA (HicA-like mRNA interferase family)
VRIPRDLDATELIKLLKEYGYVITRQTGSHIRLTTEQNGQHHITLPNHSPLKIGTLAAILTDIALHFDMTKEELMRELFN